MTKTTLINNTVCGGYCLWCGDDSGANEMVGICLLNFYCSMLYIAFIIVVFVGGNQEVL